MKPSLKNLFDSFFDNSLASSSITKLLINNIKTIATETRKIAENLVVLNERLDIHEKIITELYNKEEKTTFDYSAKRKEGASKPN